MAATNWTTKPSSVADAFFSTRVFLYVDDEGNPIMEGDDTLSKQARIEVAGRLYPDAVARPFSRSITYRLSTTSLPHDGVADGSGPSLPRPIDTADAADVAAIGQAFLRLRKQWRKDSNDDIE